MNIGDAAFSRADVMRRLHELEGIVRELVAGRRLENATVGAGGMRVRGTGGITLQQGGDLTVEDGGDVRILDSGTLERLSAEGVQVLYVGLSANGNEMFALRRTDGSDILRTGTFGDGPQFWALQDRFGNYVVSDDAETGWGIANPRLACPLYPSATSLDAIGTATSTTLETLWEGEFRVANPWLQVGFAINCAGSARAECSISFNGTEVYTSGFQSGFVVLNTGRISVRDHVDGPGDLLGVQMSLRNETSGQTCYLAPLGAYAA